MTTNPFAAPASVASIDYHALMGRLLVIEPTAVETGVQTVLGEKDAVRATIHVIDAQPPYSIEDSLIFPRVLQGQLRSRLGQMVLGRLTQGQAKQGQNPPWMIADATPADQQAGQVWLMARQSATLARPGPAQQPAAQPQVPAQPQHQPPAQQYQAPAAQYPPD